MVLSGGVTVAISCISLNNPADLPGCFFTGVIFSSGYGAPGYLDFLQHDASQFVILVTGAATGLTGGIVLLLAQQSLLRNVRKITSRWVILGATGCILGGFVSSIIILVPMFHQTPALWDGLFIFINLLNILVGLGFGLGAGLISSVLQNYHQPKNQTFPVSVILTNTFAWGIAGAIAFSVRTVLGFVLGGAIASILIWREVGTLVEIPEDNAGA